MVTTPHIVSIEVSNGAILRMKHFAEDFAKEFSNLSATARKQLIGQYPYHISLILSLSN